MNFNIQREDYSHYPLDFSIKPMENLINVISSHRLSNLFFTDGVPITTEIYIRKIGRKEFWLIANGVWVQLNPKTGDAKVSFNPDIYNYDINVKWEDFNPIEVLNKFADAVNHSEQIVYDFACRFHDVCNIKKNKEQYSCNFDIKFDITERNAIRCDIENGAAMAGTSFVCSLDKLRDKNAQEIFDAISYTYTDEEL